ncbi:hypothetical protein NADE_008926 [Nannochloris sp. 'desiccata']|nr:hypothetical protein NADE_008926 [Chlorella desiccata (nom. nud.)]
MPLPEPLILGGSIIGFAAASVATFITVSYLEVKDKINNQIISGEDPYELQVEKQRKKPAQKKKSNKRK